MTPRFPGWPLKLEVILRGTREEELWIIDREGGLNMLTITCL